MSAETENGPDAGFSLLEVIVAFTILAISLSYVVQTISSGTQMFNRSANLSRISIAVEDLWVREVRDVNGVVDKSGTSPEGIRWRLTSEAIPTTKKVPLYVVRIEMAESENSSTPYRFTYILSGKP